MRGRQFLELAKEVLAGATERHWRGAAVHAHYALMLECRDALVRWGFTMPRRDNVHSYVRLPFAYATDDDLKTIGDALDTLVKLRNRASYDLSATDFSSGSRTQRAVQTGEDALALLDAIEADPARLTEARAAITP